MSPGEPLTRVDICHVSVYSRVCLYLVAGICCVGTVISNHDVAAGESEEQGRSREDRLDSIENYDITYPLWLQPARLRRTSDGEQQHPSEAEVLITAEGEEMTLRL
ncbi:hypothetical protein DPEC_G00020510, partial [Dallia pectoralis]